MAPLQISLKNCHSEMRHSVLYPMKNEHYRPSLLRSSAEREIESETDFLERLAT